MALASRRLIRRLNLEETRGRVHQLLTQGWGLATAPLYRNAIFIMSSSVVGAASGFVFYFIIARFYSVSDLGYAQGVFNTISFLATLALLGLGPALVRFLPSAENKAATINTCLTLTGLVAIPLTIALPVGIAVAFEGGILLPRVLPGYRPKPSLDLSHIRPMVRFSTANYLAATIGAADTSC